MCTYTYIYIYIERERYTSYLTGSRGLLIPHEDVEDLLVVILSAVACT